MILFSVTQSPLGCGLMFTLFRGEGAPAGSCAFARSTVGNSARTIFA